MSKPFQVNFSFLYPLKTSENLWFSDVFRGYRKETFGLKWGEIEDYTASHEKWENGRWRHIDILTYFRRSAKFYIQYQTSKQSLFLTSKAARDKDATETPCRQEHSLLRQICRR